MDTSTTCFVIMPFSPELNYFYLYLQHYLESRHDVHVQRGDHQILTVPLLEKIRKQIDKADFVIADISGSNPNVFYELGLAHADEQQRVILLNGDRTEDGKPKVAPTDIRHFEFIPYDLGSHREFLARLDNAVGNIVAEKLVPLYEQAITLLDEFNSSTTDTMSPTSFEDFKIRIINTRGKLKHLSTGDDDVLARYLLPKIVDDPTDPALSGRLNRWLDDKYRQPLGAKARVG